MCLENWTLEIFLEDAGHTLLSLTIKMVQDVLPKKNSLMLMLYLSTILSILFNKEGIESQRNLKMAIRPGMLLKNVDLQAAMDNKIDVMEELFVTQDLLQNIS